MSLQPNAIDPLPFVEAELTYLAPMMEKPRTYTYEPPPGVPRMSGKFASHKLRVHDARPIAGELSLDREGFALVQHHSKIRDFYDETELRRVYYPEIEELVAKSTGANRVVVFDHTIRRRIPGVADGTAGAPRQPVPRVHNDYTVISGPRRVRDLMGDEAEDLLRRRFAIVNIWRPIRGPLRDRPLALCDARSAAFADFVASELVYRDRVGETYAVTHNPAHRWFYAPAMSTDEVLLLKVYDSAEDGRARFAPHASFEDPTTPPDALPRESIELRTLLFFPD